MRLHLTLPELEQGSSTQVGPSERIMELKFTADRREPIAIVPICNHDRKVISAVLVTEYTDLGKSTGVRIKFRPIWSKIFTVCSFTKDTLQAVLCELANGQFWVDMTGSRPCKMTTNGDGTDPKIVQHSQEVLGELLVQRPRQQLMQNLINLLQQNC
jgi:hypothetical protein